MRWLKRDLWKTGIAIGGMLLLLVLMVWVPVSAVGAQERVSGLATLGPGTVQVTPTVDPTMTALEKEKLAQEIDQLKNQNYWAWTTTGPILVGFAGLLAALYSFITCIRNRQDEQKKQREDRNLEREKRDEEQKRWLEDRKAERERRDEEQRRWLEDQKAEREKRAEERFQAVVEGLGSERNEAKVGAAIMLRTFLRPGYEQFYTQTFDLAVANLRLRNVDPNIPEPLDTLSQALIVVFKEAFPLAQEELKKQLSEQNSQFKRQLLDASRIQLDNAYLNVANLKEVWMQEAFLRKVDLTAADLSRANLWRTKLNETFLWGADLSGTLLRQADLSGANLEGADLSGVHSLEKARFLKGTDLRGAKGLTKEQLATCKAKGAIIDEDTTTSSSQSTVSPPPPPQSNDEQAPSATPAQGSIPTPDTGGSNAASSKPGPES